MRSRQNFNRLLKLSSSLLLTLFLICSVVGCGACDAPGPKGKKAADKPTDTPKKFKKIVALLHGLNCPDDLMDLEGKLKVDLPEYEIIRLVRNNSTQVATTQQAGEMYHQLKNQLDQKGIAGSSPICLIGDSHGGLVALEMYRLHKDDLNIKGIITNHSPLEGAPGIGASSKSIKDFKDTLKNIIPANTKIGINSMLQITYPGTTLDNFLDGLDLKSIVIDDIKEPVSQDLTFNSTLLENVKTTLLNIQIPVLLLGAEVDIKTAIVALLGFVLGENQFSQFIVLQLENILNNSSSEGLVELETKFEAVIGDKRNDAFIPTYSQIAENILSSKLQDNIRRIRSRSFHHFYGITKHTEIYNKLIDFINQVFELKNNRS